MNEVLIKNSGKKKKMKKKKKKKKKKKQEKEKEEEEEEEGEEEEEEKRKVQISLHPSFALQLSNKVVLVNSFIWLYCSIKLKFSTI